MRACKACGERIYRGSGKSKFCSDTCRIAHQAVQQVLQRAKRYTRVCKACGSAFTTRSSGQIYCPDKCRSKVAQERKQPYENTNAYQLRFSILTRDGFRCRYCGHSAQEEGIKLEVDHIVPKSMGGVDEPANLITCCSKCNKGKGKLLLLAKAGQVPSYLTIESLVPK